MSHHVGSRLCYYILTSKGDILSRATVQNLNEYEVENEEVQEEISGYMSLLNKTIGQE